MVNKLLNNGKINFVIDSFLSAKDYISGGIIALDKLAYELAVRGHNVYIFCEPRYPHENIHTIPSKVKIISGHKYVGRWTPFEFLYDNTVAIYPEHSRKDFSIKHNVRWIMYHTSKKDEEYFNDDDYIFNYGNFKTYTNKSNGKLRVIDYNRDMFFIENNGVKRNGFCYIAGKETPKNYKEILSVFNPKNLTPLKGKVNMEELRHEFNKHEYFITFDDKTFLTTAAAMCGCKSIILLPEDRDVDMYDSFVNGVGESAYTISEDFKRKMKPIEYKSQNLENMFGVAYGIEDISWASKTLHMVNDYIDELDELNKDTIDRFVKFWEEKLNLKKID